MMLRLDGESMTVGGAMRMGENPAGNGRSEDCAVNRTATEQSLMQTVG